MKLCMDEILEKDNLENAIMSLLKKKNSCGTDGIYVNEFREFWKMNEKKILEEIREGRYVPGVVQEREIILTNGKHRKIMNYTCTDRVILRAISVKLQEEFEKYFSIYSYAYRKNIGSIEAAEQAATYIQNGKIWVAEIDIKDFFENINLDSMIKLLKKEIKDPTLFDLVEKYLYCKIQSEDSIYAKTEGLVQGSSMSPVLSNLYLNKLDKQLEEEKFSFCRFADNINIYAEDRSKALACFERARNFLGEVGLQINENKSGIFPAINRSYLGFGFEYCRENKVIIKKIKKRKYEYYKAWHQSAIQKVDKNFHIINDGILTKRDYTLLFENEENKRYLPVETTSNINVYSDVIFSSGFFEFAGNNNLRVTLYNKYGNFIGAFYPEKHALAANMILKQVTLYNDESKRLNVAKKILIGAGHNMRMNLKYYKKRGKEFEKEINAIAECIVQMNESKSIQELMLVEARCRQKYYQCFDKIIDDSNFLFQKRTKRPPENAVNALISFGNVFLYERLATEITKSSLDTRIGILHTTNKRNASLNLDIAEIFKPIIVDRIIFMMIHRRIIREEHFEKYGERGVYLNQEGKKVYIQELCKKLNTKIKVKGRKITYEQVMREEIKKIYRLVEQGETYFPYKYY